MAIAYADLRRARDLDWGIGAAPPRSRRSPFEQAGLGLVAFARILKEALTASRQGAQTRTEKGVTERSESWL